MDWGGVTDSGSKGPLVRFDWSPPPPSSSGRTEAGAPATNAGERRLLAASGGRGWIRTAGAFLPVVEGSTVVEEVVGGELHSGGSFGSKVILWRRWLPIKIKQGNEFTGG